MPPETLRFHIPCRGAVREDDMRGNLKDALKLFAIVATAAGLMLLTPAQVQAKAAGTAASMSANHRNTTRHVNSHHVKSQGPKVTDDSGTTRTLNRMSAAGTLKSRGSYASDRNIRRNRAANRRVASVATHSKGATHLRGSAVAIESGTKSAPHMRATAKRSTKGPNASGAVHSKGATHVHAMHAHSTVKRRHVAHHPIQT